SGSVLNKETPPANRAQPISPAASQGRGIVTTDCHPAGGAAVSSPPVPVAGVSTRVPRLHTRYILRFVGWLTRARDVQPAAEEVPAGQQPEPGGQHNAGEGHDTGPPGQPGQQHPPVPAQAEGVVRDGAPG